tara:strand:- start:7866 stop:8804 length:939 start_codon:yes stop_codon:yes gene_type:complete
MNKILILGYSSICIRRVIPALNKMEEIESIEIASKSKSIDKLNKLENVYNSYEEALEKSDAAIVYISLPNSFHYEYCKKSILTEKNVIVDKPGVLNSSELENLIELIKNKNLFLSQSCVFEFHKAWKIFKEYSKKYENGTLSSTFLIPELDKDNFRMSKHLGGGSINDMGIYASQSGRSFWGRNAKGFSIVDETIDDDKVNTGFTGKANYGEGKEAIFKFGFNKEYQNNITFKNNEFSISYERAFSPTVDLNTHLIIKNSESSDKIESGTDDTFSNYLKDIYDKYDKNEIDIINKEFKNSMNEFLNLKKELN